MNKKFAWLVVSCFMVTSLVLASCAPATTPATPVTPTTPTTPTTPVTPITPTTPENTGMVKLSLKKLDGTPVEKLVAAPKYGGTYVEVLNVASRGWDGYFQNSKYMEGMRLSTDELLTGDWTRGPAGTEESTWWVGHFISHS